jgi:hypothetical protein
MTSGRSEAERGRESGTVRDTAYSGDGVFGVEGLGGVQGKSEGHVMQSGIGAGNKTIDPDNNFFYQRLNELDSR